MSKVFHALVDVCDVSAARGRRNSAETILGFSTQGPFDTHIGAMLKALACYADSHARQYASPIADDGLLGEAWRDALRGVRALLNGETGRLDCGDVDKAILDMYRAAGFRDEL